MLKRETKNCTLRIIKSYLLLNVCTSVKEMYDFLNCNDFRLGDITLMEVTVLLRDARNNCDFMDLCGKSVVIDSNNTLLYYLKENELVFDRLIEEGLVREKYNPLV